MFIHTSYSNNSKSENSKKRTFAMNVLYVISYLLILLCWIWTYSLKFVGLSGMAGFCVCAVVKDAGTLSVGHCLLLSRVKSQSLLENESALPVASNDAWFLE